ncbi:cysteine desulfurase family protein [Anaerovorax sp. IOR16]|uniref:cysteine desulfurase family protein n=1 Tax=Anaerovorax sp. IOR16 TaxID=2773458 RepID=UPI0019D2BCAC|nr:cysteine desulfurase family protein [Anaerovorax sp. IOR16]
MIYVDNAATTKLDIDAFEAMKPFLIEDFGNPSQPYSFSRTGKRALRQARAIIAECIGAEPEEIFFTSGGTESNNWAVKGTSLVYGDTRTTITSKIEHHAVLNACAAIERLGFPVVYLPVDSEGIVQPANLQKYISNRTKLVSIMLANNEIGSIQPIQKLCNIAHENGALFHTDAVQAVGHITVDVNELGVDMLSSSAHKFNGPKGIGFLYIRKGTNIQPYADGGSQEFGMRAGTENVAAIVAMATALKKCVNNIAVRAKRLKKMENLLINTLSNANIDFLRNGCKDGLPGIISLSFKNLEGEMLLHRLDLMGIYVSTGSACNSVNTQVSHVIEAIGVPEAYSKGTIRISFGANNEDGDAEMIANALIRILSSN